MVESLAQIWPLQRNWARSPCRPVSRHASALVPLWLYEEQSVSGNEAKELSMYLLPPNGVKSLQKNKVEQLKEVANEAIHHGRHFEKPDCGREGHMKVFPSQNTVLSLHF